MHASPKYLLVFLRTRKPVEPAYPPGKRQFESKKSKGHPFPSHFVHASPLHNEKPARIQYESIVQEAEEKSKCLETNEKRNRLITNFWVAKPKKLATRRCFYETYMIESKSKTKPWLCKEKETNYSASKQNCLSLNPKHLTGFTSSLHAILFRKTNEILNSLMQRRYEVKEIVRSRQPPWQAQRDSRSWWVCPYVWLPFCVKTGRM